MRTSWRTSTRSTEVLRVSIRAALAAASLFSMLASFSCKDQLTDPDTEPVIFPASDISYSKHVELLFLQRCAVSGCHSAGSAAGGLVLTMPSYNNLMNHQPRLVNPGSSNNSLLIQRIDGRLVPQMPFNSQPLTTNQIKGIATWIDEGALNN